jgi:hypothetical protein
MPESNGGGSSARIWEAVVYAAQFFFGGWFLFHGLNHWMHFFPQPPGSASVSSELIHALIRSGLFDWVKGVEVVVAILLLANRFVPLAAVLAFPISIVIGYLNIAVESDANALFVFFGVLSLNALIAIGHLDRLLPMFAPGNIAPNLAGLRSALPIDGAAYAKASEQAEGSFSATARRPLPILAQLVAIALGIALPVYLTMSTLPAAGEAGAAASAPAAEQAP